MLQGRETEFSVTVGYFARWVGK